MQTVINWIPGAPSNDGDNKVYWVRFKGEIHPDIMFYRKGYYRVRNNSNKFGPNIIGQLVECHAPYEPPKVEIINPSAREMIEAEIEVIKKQCEIDGHPAAKIARKGALYMGNFALKCFDKPSEPMEEK